MKTENHQRSTSYLHLLDEPVGKLQRFLKDRNTENL
jgi:hypothetical protein